MRSVLDHWNNFILTESILRRKSFFMETKTQLTIRLCLITYVLMQGDGILQYKWYTSRWFFWKFLLQSGLPSIPAHCAAISKVQNFYFSVSRPAALEINSRQRFFLYFNAIYGFFFRFYFLCFIPSYFCLPLIVE